MNRRLYFLFPSVSTARAAVEELARYENVPRTKMHAIAKQGVDTSELPAAGEHQSKDVQARLAWLFWEAEVIIFFMALLGLIMALLNGAWLWAGVAILVMLFTFFSGAYYAMYIPNVSLQEFRYELAHGEILLMVDVPFYRVAAVEKRIIRHHKTAVPGGRSWTVDMFGI